MVLLRGSNTPKGRGARKLTFAGWPGVNFILVDNATQTEDSWALCAKYFCSHPRVPAGSLLILDGHSSRVSLAAIEFFRKKGNDLFTIGAHASHVEQPFDIAAAKPRSANVRRAIDMVRLGTPGVPGVSVSMDNIMSPIRDGFHKTMAPLFDSKTGKSISIPSIAFKKAGILPWNPNLTDEELFGPAVYFDDAVVKARPSLPLPSSPVKLAAVKKHTAAVIEAGDIDAALSDVVKRKHKPAVPGCTLLTGDEYTAVVVSEANVKLAKEDAISVKRVATAKAKAEKLAAIERGEVPKKRKYVKKAKPIAAAAFSALDIALPIPPAKRQKKKA